ncbi:hypothetical protein QTN25_010592 [Entamoeba marina]
MSIEEDITSYIDNVLKKAVSLYQQTSTLLRKKEKEVETLKYVISDLQKAVDSGNNELKTTKQRCNDLENELGNVNKLVKKIQKEKQELEKKYKDIKIEHSKELKTKNEQLTQKTNRISELTSTIHKKDKIIEKQSLEKLNDGRCFDEQNKVLQKKDCELLKQQNTIKEQQETICSFQKENKRHIEETKNIQIEITHINKQLSQHYEQENQLQKREIPIIDELKSLRKQIDSFYLQCKENNDNDKKNQEKYEQLELQKSLQNSIITDAQYFEIKMNGQMKNKALELLQTFPFFKRITRDVTKEQGVIVTIENYLHGWKIICKRIQLLWKCFINS